MSKVLKTAAFVVGAAALIVATAGIGAAAPLTVGAASVSTTAATGFGAIAATGSIAGFTAAATGASLFGLSAASLGLAATGLNLAASLTAQRPVLGAGGSQTSFNTDPNSGIPYVIGRTYFAGKLVHKGSWGTDRSLLAMVLVWSGAGPIQGFEKYLVDGQEVTFTGENAGGAFSNYMWLDRQLGAAPEADALHPPAGQGSMPGWTAASKLSGYAAGLWTLKYDKNGKKYPGGVPKFGAVLNGVKVYDPRLDSTYPGGSGPCRPLVESTYVYSENPWLHALTFALGRVQNGKFVIGAEQEFETIDVQSFVEAANVADGNNWKAGGVVWSTDDRWQVMKALCQAGGGEPVRMGGMLSCIVNAPRVSLGTITSADLAGPPGVTATYPRKERINGVIPSYRSEAHSWEMATAKAVRIDQYVAFDGRRRTREFNYPLVQVAAGQPLNQVAELAAYDIYNSREIPNISLPLKLRFIGLKPGDCWTIDIPEIAVHNQLAMVRHRSFDPGAGVPTIAFRSETTGKHAAALGLTTEPPPTPTVGTGDPGFVPAPAAGSWNVAGTTLTANDVSIPALVVTGAIDNATAGAIVFEYRVDGSSVWSSAGTEDAGTTRKEITGITPGTAYEVAVSYKVRDVTGNRLVLGPVTSGDFEIPGSTGVPGSSNALVYIFQRAPFAPPLPSATSTYTFATGGIAGLNGGWSATIPAGSNPLFVSTAIASSTGATDTIAAGEWATPVIHAQNGVDGTDGINTATIFLYQRNNTGAIPSVPSATLTYEFASGQLTGSLNGWSRSVPDEIGGRYLFVTTATALSTTPTDFVFPGEWAGVRRLAQDGSEGVPGSNNGLVYIYQRAASPPTLPSANAVYTFATGAITGLNNGWSRTIPTGTNPLYVSTAVASAPGGTDTIAPGEWAAPVVLAQDGGNGSNGLNAATVYLYQRNNTGTAPAVPASTLTYTFATGALSGTLGGWAQSVPAEAGGRYLFVTTATALATAATDTIASGEWATVRQLARDGTDGQNGNQQVMVFVRSVTQPATPSGNGVPAGWSAAQPAWNGQYMWMSRSIQTLAGVLVSGWTTPIRWEGTAGLQGLEQIDTGTAPNTVQSTGYQFLKQVDFYVNPLVTEIKVTGRIRINDMYFDEDLWDVPAQFYLDMIVPNVGTVTVLAPRTINANSFIDLNDILTGLSLPFPETRVCTIRLWARATITSAYGFYFTGKMNFEAR